MKIIDCVQGTEEWFLARLGKATTSCFSKAIAGGQGKTRKTYMIQLVAERLTGEPQDNYNNAAMQHGSETEPLAREYYSLINDVTVEQVGFIERDDDIGCSPDGLVGADGMTEFKCPNSSTHITYLLEDRLPTTYKAQVQGNLWVAERQWIDFVSYDPRVTRRPYFCKRVFRDDAYIIELNIKLVMFVNELKETMEKLTKSPF